MIVATPEVAGWCDGVRSPCGSTLGWCQTPDARAGGIQHPDVLTSRNNVAYALEASGELQQAAAQYENVLADAQRLLSSDHPLLAVVRKNLSRIVSRCGSGSHAAMSASTTQPSRSVARGQPGGLRGSHHRADLARSAPHQTRPGTCVKPTSRPADVTADTVPAVRYQQSNIRYRSRDGNATPCRASPAWSPGRCTSSKATPRPAARVTRPPPATPERNRRRPTLIVAEVKTVAG